MAKLKIIIALLFLTILMGSCGILSASQLPYRFDHLTVDDGLISNAITSIVQDSCGFIWIGSYHGLQRYDSYEFKTYQHDLDDSTSPNSNSLYGLFIDSKNILWIKTVGSGINEYDAINDQFIHYVHDPADPNSISGDYVKEIVEDKNKNFYIATWNGGLCYMDRATKKFQRIVADIEDPNGLKEDNLMLSSIMLDDNDILWIGSTKGLYSYNTKSKIWQKYEFDQDQSSHLKINDISKVYQTPDGNIWVGTWGGGIKIVDKKNKTLKHFPHHKRNSRSKVDDRIYSLFYDSFGNFWGSLEGGGLLKILVETDSIVRITHNPSNPHSLNSNSIFSMYQDRSGMLWFASHYGGINLLSLQNQQFNHIYPLKDNPDHLSGGVIHCISEDQSGLIWLGTHSNGVNIYNTKTNKFKHLKHDPKNPNSIFNPEIRAIEANQNRGMWLGTASGLDYYDIKTGSIIHYQHEPNNPNSISHNLIFDLCEDSKGNLWIGTYNEGLSYFNLDTKTFTHFKHDPDDSNTINNNIIQHIYIDSKKRTWIATRSGLNLYIPETKTFKRYFNRNIKQQSTYLTSIFEDHNGVIWISGNTGLFRFELDENNELKNVRQYTKKDGLSSNMISGILEDSMHYLWIATAYGINRFNPETGENTIFTKNDGLQSNMFNENAYHYSKKSGLMFYGGSNGFNVFDPTKIRLDINSSPIILTDIKLFNESVKVGKKYKNHIILQKPIHMTQAITLKYFQNDIAFRFAVMDFKVEKKNQYAYRLKGFESDWNKISKKHEANYTNLDPGKYLFEVKRLTRTGQLSNNSAYLNIHISKPFWETIIFRALIILLLGALIYTAAEYRVYALKKQQLILEEKIAERTKALQNSNQELEQFAYVASHDLQEPLRMVTSYLQLLERRYKDQLDETANEFIDFAVDGAKRMQQLISDLLSYSRIRTQGKPFKPVDMQETTDHVVMNLEFAIAENKAQIYYKNLPTIQADSIQIERLLQNLIGNAIKYRKSDEDPVVHIKAKQKGHKWIFSIQDNSIGIPEDQYDRIFNVFQRLHGRDEYSGTGIGLASCKKIIERHKGKIWVESKLGQGSTFYFSLPLD